MIEENPIRKSAANHEPESEFLQQAIRIGQLLRNRAIQAKDDSCTWVGPEYALDTGRYVARRIGASLYGGSCGIALFFSSLHAFTHNENDSALVLSTLQTIRKQLTGTQGKFLAGSLAIGGIGGLGSVVYTLLWTGKLLNNLDLIDDSIRISRLITRDSIDNDSQYDVMDGSAGAILSLLALYKSSHEKDILRQAKYCGDHLLKRRTVTARGYRAWKTTNSSPLTGFSHGASGIAHALLQLYQFNGNDRYRQAAEEAFAYERSVFSPEDKNWPDFRIPIKKNGHPAFRTNWCNGAAGIGLARLAAISVLRSKQIREEAEIAIETTRKYGLKGTDDLCCGNMGRIETLMMAGRKLRRPELLQTAKGQASEVVRLADRKEAFSLQPNLRTMLHPGFFKGIAGIGYTLLRLSDRGRRLPCVLLLE